MTGDARVHLHAMVEHELAIARRREPRLVVRREHVADVRVGGHVLDRQPPGHQALHRIAVDAWKNRSAIASCASVPARSSRPSCSGSDASSSSARTNSSSAHARPTSRRGLALGPAPRRARDRGRTARSRPRSTRGTPTAGTAGRAGGTRPRGSRPHRGGRCGGTPRTPRTIAASRPSPRFPTRRRAGSTTGERSCRPVRACGRAR